MLIGYMRVSKADGCQTLDLQRDALLAADIEPGHQSSASAARLLALSAVQQMMGARAKGRFCTGACPAGCWRRWRANRGLQR